MTNAAEAQALIRENDYLKLRCAQLQEDVTDLTSQVFRLQQMLEIRIERRSSPNPLSGGQ